MRGAASVAGYHRFYGGAGVLNKKLRHSGKFAFSEPPKAGLKMQIYPESHLVFLLHEKNK
jgi:hypothetical protein